MRTVARYVAVAATAAVIIAGALMMAGVLWIVVGWAWDHLNSVLQFLCIVVIVGTCCWAPGYLERFGPPWAPKEPPEEVAAPLPRVDFQELIEAGGTFVATGPAWESYQRWLKTDAHCMYCKAKHSADDREWVTEVLCSTCWKTAPKPAA